jgi:hypothetical protein
MFDIPEFIHHYILLIHIPFLLNTTISVIEVAIMKFNLKMIKFMRSILNIMVNQKVGDGTKMLMSNYLKLSQFQI